LIIITIKWSKKMPKKIKLNLEDLKVESFVTSLNRDEKDDIKGGNSMPSACPSDACGMQAGSCSGNELCGTITGNPCQAC
jgi:hypothetical protein